MFFRKSKEKSEQRGTLMVEAIAMLGLIAIVTPTLYKKSAERLQEIQDINIASQARTMSQVIESFVRNHSTAFRDFDSAGTVVVELCKESSCAGQSDHLDQYLKFGYSSAIPHGFMPDEIKNYGEPRVFAVAEDGNVVFYIVYPKVNDIGKKRTARLASLIGANGGFVQTASTQVLGTGGAWELDSSMINEFKLPKELLTENSLVLTNNEPITTKMDDTDIFLYRVPPTTLDEFYHNTMVSDLYLGGNGAGASSRYENDAKDYYSIFNVRKMTLNTRCSAQYIYDSSMSDSAYCDPDVADLYVGKPFGKLREDPVKSENVGGASSGKKNYEANTGAAWIYGNFAALSDRFKVFNTAYDNTSVTYDRKGFDVMQFSRLDSSVDVWDGNEDDQQLAVLSASNEENSAYVSMMNGLVRVVEQLDGPAGSPSAFLVGGSSWASSGSGHLIAAYNDAGGVVHINSLHNSDSITRINDYGGTVYINGGDSTVADERADTYINQGGGNLFAGKDGDWINAGGIGDSTHVDILRAGSSGTGGNVRRFSVGGEKFNNHMIYADSSVTSLRDGAIRAYTANAIFDNVGGTGVLGATGYGGPSDTTDTIMNNGAVVAARYTDILGATYIGYKSKMNANFSTGTGESDFVRDNWALGVAGSAWVDELLFANDAWFNKSGFKELHAGFSTYAEYQKSPRKGWLNAYDDGVVINNRRQANDNSTGVGGVHADYTRFFADEDRVYMGDSLGAMAHLEDGVAKFGYTDRYSSGLPDPINFVGADSTRAFVEGDKLVELYTSSDVIGSSDAVDIQKGAMLFKGHSWENNARATHSYDRNEIEAHAGRFTLQTAKVVGVDEDGNKIEGIGPEASMLYADGEQIRTRFVDFKVQSNSSENILHVRPNMDASSASDSANVTVNGSFYVTGNDVIHTATYNDDTKSGRNGNPHATFEIDPQFVRVMARKGATSSSFIEQDGNTLAMFEVNSYDIDGTSSRAANAGEDPTRRASVYVRRGAIELEESTEGNSSAADEGYGYIKANRLVSNVGGLSIPNAPGSSLSTTNHYDQYMVNPAYTSVMHDIKLTTRGGARLSDILPDYVLKGVYNVSNDFVEGGKNKSDQLCWSSGRTSNCKNEKIAWADSYVGRLPYAICPPGYKNLATIIPTSFQMAQAGDMVKSTAYGGGSKGRDKAYVINPAGSRQANILSVAKTTGEIAYPNLVKSVSLEVNKAYDSDKTHDVADLYLKRTEGWFFGYDALRKNDTDPTADTESRLEVMGADASNPEKRSAYKYFPGMDTANRTTGFVPEPLYFQQNTFLKTSLDPQSFDVGGWDARMGFIYDMQQYTGYDDSGLGNAGIKSQNTDGDDNESSTIPFDQPGTWVWNLFPVPTNTIEGHATVYCYFDRNEFNKHGWGDLVDNIDQLNDYRNPKKDGAKDANYKTRLNDPSLKYNDPW